ncbi:hypothetical protein [Actinoallomurus sp. CA-150999]
MEQAIRWINDPDTDAAYVKVMRRHLDDAARLLEALVSSASTLPRR